MLVLNKIRFNMVAVGLLSLCFFNHLHTSLKNTDNSSSINDYLQVSKQGWQISLLIRVLRQNLMDGEVDLVVVVRHLDRLLGVDILFKRREKTDNNTKPCSDAAQRRTMSRLQSID